MKDIPASIKDEVQHHEQSELPSGYEDPHKAALEDNPDTPEKLTLSVILSALFLGTSFTGPIIFGFILVTSILVQLSEELGGATIDFWVPSGWGAAAAVGFSVAGRISDIFGRRYVRLLGCGDFSCDTQLTVHPKLQVILFGQLLTIVGGAIAATANSMEQLIAGEVVLGASIGTVSVAYAGKYNVLENIFPLTRERPIRDTAQQISWYGFSLDRIQSR